MPIACLMRQESSKKMNKMRATMNFVVKPTLVVFNTVLAVTRTFGLLVIALGILAIPK